MARTPGGAGKSRMATPRPMSTGGTVSPTTTGTSAKAVPVMKATKPTLGKSPVKAAYPQSRGAKVAPTTPRVTVGRPPTPRALPAPAPTYQAQRGGGIDLGAFVNEVYGNVQGAARGLPVVGGFIGDLQRASSVVPSGTTSQSNNAALNKALRNIRR